MPSRAKISGALQLYYLGGTPVFVLIDVAFSAPVRVAALGGSPLRWLYYLAAFVLGLLCRRWPRLAAPVGMVESAVNLLMLTLAVLLPVWSSLETVAEGGTATGPFDEIGVANFMVSGAVFLMTFYANQRRVTRTRR